MLQEKSDHLLYPLLQEISDHLLYPLSFEDWDCSSASLRRGFPLRGKDIADSVEDMETVSSPLLVRVWLLDAVLATSTLALPASCWWDVSWPLFWGAGLVEGPPSPHSMGTLLILVSGGLVLGGMLGNDPVLSRGPSSLDSKGGWGRDTVNTFCYVFYKLNHKWFITLFKAQVILTFLFFYFLNFLFIISE